MTIAGDAAELARVRYTFSVPSREADGWRVRALHLFEALSELYVADLDLMTTEPAIDLLSFVGESATIEIIQGEHVRRIAGVVLRIDHNGNDHRHTFGRIRVVPAFALLSQRVTSRIFQNKTVPDILEIVLKEGLAPLKRTFRADLKGKYAVREYGLQHEETDRDFAERLMQEEGIWYSFEHEGESETLVLQDKNPTFLGLSEEPLFVVHSVSSSALQTGLRSFSMGKELRANTVVIRGFDWTHPALPPKGEGKGTTQDGPKREIYRHASEVLLGGYQEGSKKYKENTATSRAKLRAESLEAQVSLARGMGHVVGFAAGAMFELANHVVGALDGKYLLVRVEHRADPPAEGDQVYAELQLEPGYENQFTCLRLDTPFRPQRTLARPKIGGLQSAIVSGPGGEEIHTDHHGRIKVRFPWDRADPGDETSSCWVRVAQTWAGPGWGTQFIPRIGMEVLVAFYDGDPDRPIVVGCAYNGANPPPFELPEHKTQSGIKTQSSTGGNGNNELRFEDTAGSEEVFFQAQKDHNIVVKHDKTQDIAHDETLHVGNDRTKTVDGNQTLTVHGDDESTIDKNQSLTVVKDQETVVLAHRAISVALTQSTDVGLSASLTIGTTHEVTVGAAQSISVGASRSVEVGGSQDVSVGGDQDVSVGGSESHSVGGSQTTSVGGAFALTVAKMMDIQGSDSLTLTIAKDVVVSGDAKISQTAAKEFAVKGDKILLTAEQELGIKVGGASITLKKNGDITIKGNKITITGDGDVKVKGSKVAGN